MRKLHEASFAAALAAGAFLIGAGTSATAQTIPLSNGSFEMPDVPAGEVAFIVPDFNIGADVGIQNEGDFGSPAAAADGDQFIFLGAGDGFTNIFRDLPDLGNIVAGDPSVTGLTFTVSLATRTIDGTANGDIFVGIQDLSEPGFVGAITVVPRASLNSTGFQDFSVTLPAASLAAGDDVRIFLDKNAGNSLIVADNFRLVAVPEPTTLGLLGIGGLALLARRRRSI